VAQGYARNDDLKLTVRNLKKAKELGLQRFQAIQKLPSFTKFKQKKKFKNSSRMNRSNYKDCDELKRSV
jgi:16S rRNA U1498 N3-methylase RsmE